MGKEDRIIEILAWLCIIAVVAFCIRFNYKLYTNDYVAPEKIETSDLYI